MITEEDMLAMAKEQMERERIELNKFCAKPNIPADVKADSIIEFTERWKQTIENKNDK